MNRFHNQYKEARNAQAVNKVKALEISVVKGKAIVQVIIE